MRYILYALFFLASTGISQVVPNVVSSVDTSKKEIRQIYELCKDYLNSHPDSAYANPYWTEAEKPLITKTLRIPPDRFFIPNYWRKATNFKWTILAIDKYYGNDSTYRIRALANTQAKDAYWNGRLYDPACIIIYYAVLTSKGWKLENALSVETRTWKQYNTKYIHYWFPPEFKFNNNLANKADSFCKALADTFKITDTKPFDYYITTGTEQMGRLYNMEYWESPTMGYTEFDNRKIVSARATEYHIHEFVHMLLPRSKNSMVEEGIATLLAGTGNCTFKEGITKFSDEIKSNDTLTFTDIYTHRYFNMYDNNPFYVTGAVACKFVYEKRGITGLKQLIDCPSNSEEDFYTTICKILETNRKDIEKKIMQYIKTYSYSSNSKN